MSDPELRSESEIPSMLVRALTASILCLGAPCRASEPISVPAEFVIKGKLTLVPGKQGPTRLTLLDAQKRQLTLSLSPDGVRIEKRPEGTQTRMTSAEHQSAQTRLVITSFTWSDDRILWLLSFPATRRLASAVCIWTNPLSESRKATRPS